MADSRSEPGRVQAGTYATNEADPGNVSPKRHIGRRNRQWTVTTIERPAHSGFGT